MSAPYYADSSVTLWHGDALELPLEDATVDLVVTSPPYFGLRSYQDGGEHYAGQIGSEATPAEFVDALIAATAEMVRVLKPSGSIFVNLGDKYAGGGGQWDKDDRDRALTGSYRTNTGGNTYGLRAKSLIGVPWRYAIRCIDDLGLILRAEVIWSKPNGLPESVTDRVRRSHETWFHFTKMPRYYSAVDEIREAHEPGTHQRRLDGQPSPKQAAGLANGTRRGYMPETYTNPLGKLPGSVWTIATQPLTVPASLGIDHFAAFPMEWPRRIITGWSPAGVCTGCGEGRRPVKGVMDGATEWRRILSGVEQSECGRLFTDWEQSVTTDTNAIARLFPSRSGALTGCVRNWRYGNNVPTIEQTDLIEQHFGPMPRRLRDLIGRLVEVPARERKPRDIGGGKDQYSFDSRHNPATLGITGYACACPDTTAPTTPGVVLDPFSGTGTVALMAKVLGRRGVGVDLSADYCRLAQWRVNDPGQIASAMQVDKPETPMDDQGVLDFGGAA